MNQPAPYSGGISPSGRGKGPRTKAKRNALRLRIEAERIEDARHGGKTKFHPHAFAPIQDNPTK